MFYKFIRILFCFSYLILSLLIADQWLYIRCSSITIWEERTILQSPSALSSQIERVQFWCLNSRDFMITSYRMIVQVQVEAKLRLVAAIASGISP
jgi:hypothetical protein